MHRASLSVFRARTRRAFRQFTWGGDWAISLPSQIKQNLQWFFFDGLFASASDNIVITYLVLYILALGATRTQIGLMSSLSSLTVALLLLPGAILVERYGHRQQLTLMFGGGIARLVLLVLACLPFFLHGQLLVLAAMAFSICRDAFGNLAFPAWMSVTGDIVPMEGRGRYFGSRNFIMGIAGMVVIYLVGELITGTVPPYGYQVALGLAFLLGAFSTYSFSRIRDPKGKAPIPVEGSLSFKTVLNDMKGHPAFISLCLVMVMWNFSVNIAGPFFNVYMVQNLKFTASMVGITSIVSTVAGLVVQRWIGHLSDRLGSRKVMLISMMLIPLLPALWVFITRFWQVIALNSFGGMAWGAFNLVSFNFLLSLTPPAQRARYSAIFQIMVTLALAGGAAFGAWVVTQWNYQAIFACSAIGRIIAMIMFARMLPTSSEKEAALAQA
ncbi:MAG TPA: MFS transporter [Anaerolineales bacterium]|nr:MFS transporter [Anaerolineales bacterium]